MTKKEGYLNYIHLFRGFAILIIVSIHCRISLKWPVESLSKDVFITLLDNGTVLFVFIAGFLFQYLKRKFEYKEYLVRKAQYVLLPYIIVSLPAIISDLYSPTPIWLPDALVDQPKLLQGLYMIATGKHLGPFWFIPMIVIFYLISPLLIKIDKPVFYKFVFPILFIAGLFTYRFGFFSNSIDSFIHYLPVYIFGMASSYYRREILNLPMLWTWVLLAIYITIAVLEITDYIYVPKLSSFEEAETAPYFIFNASKLKVSLLCIVMLKLFYKVQWEVEILKVLGDYSFGIYFVHLYVITALEEAVRYFYPGFLLQTWTFITYVLLVTLLSMGVVWIVKQIFGKKSRLLIGS